MASKNRRERLYNRILFAVGTAALVLLTLWNLAGRTFTALALEQETRCGMEEHIHTDDCYIGDVLVCDQKAHTHSESCYLILLEDNDINWLLTAVDNNEAKSLEGVIEDALVQALAANGVETVPESDLSFVGGPGSEEDIQTSPSVSEDAEPSTSRTDESPEPSVPEDAEPSTSRTDEDPIPSVSEDAEPSTSRMDEVPIPSVSEDAEPSTSRTDEDPVPSAPEDAEPATSRTDEDPVPSVSEDAEPATSRTDENPVPSAPEDAEPTTSRTDEDPTSSKTEDGDTTSDETGPSMEEKTEDVASIALGNLTVTDLNQTIANNQIQPSLTLNEGLYAVPTQTASGSDVSTLAVGDTVGNAQNTVYFYIQLDGEITYVGNGSVTYNNGRNNNNRYYYISFEDIAGIYNYNTSELITALTEDNINEEYYFTYGTSAITEDNIDDLSVAGTKSGNRLNLGNSNSGTNARYAILTTRSNNAYTPINFYTVTLDYSAVDSTKADDVQYVQSGQISTLSLSDEYEWYTKAEGGTKVTTATPGTISATTTLYARPKAGNITYQYADGTQIAIYENLSYKSNHAIDNPPDGYIWTDENGVVLTVTSITVNGNRVFTAVPATYTVTYLDIYGDVVDEITVGYAQTITVDAPDANCVWVGSDDTVYFGGESVKITGSMTFTATETVTATFAYADGSTDSNEPVVPGTTITLPTLAGGSAWVDEDGNTYSGGDTVRLLKDTTFYEEIAITIRYDVNYSKATSGTVSTMPYIVGAGSGITTLTESVTEEDGRVVVRSVTPREVYEKTGESTGRNGYFAGWQVGDTNTVLAPGTRLSWAELLDYADADGEISLTGVWKQEARESALFFIRYDSVAVDTEGNINSDAATEYTPTLFATHVGGTDGETNLSQYNLADETADNSYTVDQKIRALYGEKTSGVWLYDFPDDDDVFVQLQEYADNLEVDGEPVAVEDLDSNKYAIRWYVFKTQDDAWHIDGKLVKKEGFIHVTKTFSGNETLVEEAKDGFTIAAVNEENTKSHTLTLSDAIDDGDGNSNTYLWEIGDVEYGERWTITEYPSTVTDATIYSEWVVVDASADSQSASGDNTTVKVTGVTHATDLDDLEWLRVEFNNIYYRSNSLMLKKEDGKTGQALGGARFQLYQAGERMTFDYDADTGLYEYQADGGGAIDTLTCDGYVNVNISTTGFSYDLGDVVVREIAAPDGYNLVGDINIGYMTGGGTGITNPNESASYAEYRNGLLIVKNNSDPVSVTAEKHWECDEDYWENITVQLLANGSANQAAQLLASSGQSSLVTLTARNSYSYTWDELPVYANGGVVTWSIREMSIGDEDCKSDYTFANWIVTYDNTAYDADGNVILRVYNTPKRPTLYLVKTDQSGQNQLPGATFTLVEADADGNPVSGAIAKTATTDENGRLQFDNLKYNTWYQLTEVDAPRGYIGFSDPAYLYLAEDGTVTVTAHDYVKAGGYSYLVTAVNQSGQPLPETGNFGIYWFICGGTLLMTAAVLLLIYQTRRRREDDLPHA